LVALCSAALAAGPPATSAIIIGGGGNTPFYITHGGVCLTKESFLAPLLANEAGKMGLWIELIQSIKICTGVLGVGVGCGGGEVHGATADGVCLFLRRAAGRVSRPVNKTEYWIFCNRF
jgi:hypothetical protein